MEKELTFNLNIVKVLRNKNFLKLWVSQVLSQITTHLIAFTLILKIYKVTGSAFFIALMILAYSIPAVLFAFFGGAYGDRFSRKRILVITNFIQAIIVLFYLLVGLRIWWIFLILFIYSLVNQFYFPAEGAMIPCVVKSRDLLSANSLYMFTFHISYILGFAAASPVVTFWGERVSFWGGSLMLILAGLAALSLPSDKACKYAGNKWERFYIGIFADIKECWRFVTTNWEVALPIIDITLSSAIIGILAVLSPAIALDIAELPLSLVGFFIIVPAALGMLLGTLIVGNLGDFHNTGFQRRLVRGGVNLAALTLIFGAYSKRLILFLGLENFVILRVIVVSLAFLLGLGGGFILTPARTLIYKSTTNHLLGRVLSVLGALITFTSSLPVLLAGVIVDLFSVSVMLLGLGFLLLAYNLLFGRGWFPKGGN